MVHGCDSVRGQVSVDYAAHDYSCEACPARERHTRRVAEVPLLAVHVMWDEALSAPASGRY